MSDPNQLITSLKHPSIYQHDVDEISVIETHISWVLLTGLYAYKIKKPVNFGFVDFSSLEKRKFYCFEEIRLNSRLAPEIYLQVVAIYGSAEQPSFIETGEPIEYAVKMRQFSQHDLLSDVSKQKQLEIKHIVDMARVIAAFHANIDKASAIDNFSTPEDVHSWVMGNIAQIETRNESDKCVNALHKLKNWSEDKYKDLYEILRKRKVSGFVRECHGDMHLGNMALLHNKVTIFDGIDFNDHLRWIDVMSEVAFVVMDLQKRDHSSFANQFLNLYLQHTGDYSGLRVLNYYLVYRALVRAKVAILRLTQNQQPEIEKKYTQDEFESYIKLATNFIAKKNISFAITHGLSGSGKSTYSELLLNSANTIRLRSDIERKRLHGYVAEDSTDSLIDQGIYTLDSSYKTYERLAMLAKCIMLSGYSVIVDACFLQRELRENFLQLANELHIPFIILDFYASEAVLRQRIITRSKDQSEPSEADLTVLDSQLKKYVALDENEKKYSIHINTEDKVDIEEVIKQIKDRSIS